jgi:hypothetical protein
MSICDVLVIRVGSRRGGGSSAGQGGLPPLVWVDPVAAVLLAHKPQVLGASFPPSASVCARRAPAVRPRCCQEGTHHAQPSAPEPAHWPRHCRLNSTRSRRSGLEVGADADERLREVLPVQTAAEPLWHRVLLRLRRGPGRTPAGPRSRPPRGRARRAACRAGPHARSTGAAHWGRWSWPRPSCTLKLRARRCAPPLMSPCFSGYWGQWSTRSRLVRRIFGYFNGQMKSSQLSGTLHNKSARSMSIFRLLNVKRMIHVNSLFWVR